LGSYLLRNVEMCCGIPNAYILDKKFYQECKRLGSIFLERPEDDSVRIEACCPNTIKNIIKVCYI